MIFHRRKKKSCLARPRQLPPGDTRGAKTSGGRGGGLQIGSLGQIVKYVRE